MAFRMESLRLDPDRAEEGVWFDYAEDPDGGPPAQVKLAAFDNPRFQAKCQELARPMLRNAPFIGGTRNKDGSMKVRLSREQEEWIQRVAFSETVLLGWKNLTEADGAVVDYSPEKALEWFEKYPVFYNDLVRMSTQSSQFAVQQEAEAEKNSATP